MKIKIEIKRGGNFTKMLRAVWTNLWISTLQSSIFTTTYLPSFKKTKVWLAIHDLHCWKSREKLLIVVFIWTPTHGHTRVSRPAKTYILPLRVDTRCHLEKLKRLISYRDSIPWWWWWWWWWWWNYIFFDAKYSLKVLNCNRNTHEKQRLFSFKEHFKLHCFGLVFWHINDCWLFNAKSCFYISRKYVICKHRIKNSTSNNLI